MHYSTWWKLVGASSVLLACTACGESGQADPEDFVSDNPGGPDGGRDDAGDPASGGDTGDDENGGDGEREIAEADIVAVRGDRLYALSQFGGLAIVDVSNPSQLPVLGRYRAQAMPFEMYVEGTRAFVMFSDFGSYDWDTEAESYVWHSSSRLLALDASNPADIKLEAEFELPGELQDSRRVGDVLYLVTHENGYCWNCKSAPNTTITSLDISDLTDVKQIDQLSFASEDRDNGWWWDGRRSVSATNERMYVAGPEIANWNDWQSAHSVIDVVDISNPAGQLVHSTQVPVAGTIQSRWQMDEHEGVLRVVSQPGFWGGTNPPVIETFAISASDAIEPLGHLQMVLPRPESLQSVRFDGERGFAITFEQTDPLFTLDLSDPATPLQVGELEIPGWVHHMEVRGDRILGLGFEPGNPDGVLNVSLFDISNFADPTMLRRVYFGGDWASFGEDQNRLHKAFTILEDEGLLLVPYSGWSWSDSECWGTSENGVQLIDWANDDLVLRGSAPSHGRARRALMHKDHLLGVSDLAVESFDISNRDAPSRVADTALATNVSSVIAADDLIVRVATDWWSNRNSIEIVAKSDPESPDPIGRLYLDDYVDPGQDPESCGYLNLYNADLFVHEGHLFIARDVYDWQRWENHRLAIDVIDIRNPSTPTHLTTQTFDISRGWGAWLDMGERNRAVHIGNALAFVNDKGRWEDDGWQSDASLSVVDISTPTSLSVVDIERSEAMAHGGLTVADQDAVSWSMRDAGSGKVRFFLERFDLSDPGDPTARPVINVPGQVVHYDVDAQRALTLDYRIERAQLPEEGCWRHPKVFESRGGECLLLHRELKVAAIEENGARLLSTLNIEGVDSSLRGIIASDDRVYVHTNAGYGSYGGDAVDGYGGWGGGWVSNDSLKIASGWPGDELTLESTMNLSRTGWIYRLQAAGQKVLFHTGGGIGIVDATDPAAPTLEIEEVVGWGCQNLDIDGTDAYCSMGQFGLQHFRL